MLRHSRVHELRGCVVTVTIKGRSFKDFSINLEFWTAGGFEIILGAATAVRAYAVQLIRAVSYTKLLTGRLRSRQSRHGELSAVKLW